MIFSGSLTGSFSLHSINTVSENTTAKVVLTNDSFKPGFIDLFPIRNLYLISNTLGTHNSMIINGEWFILKKIPVNAGYNEMVYDKTVLGMDYLDCSNQTLSHIDFKIKDLAGNTMSIYIRIMYPSLSYSLRCPMSRRLFLTFHVFILKLYRMSEYESTPPPTIETTEQHKEEPTEPQEVPQEEPIAKAKPKRKAKEPKKSRVIAVAVHPTEYFDAQAPPTPPTATPEVIKQQPVLVVKPKAKAKPRGKAKSKVVAEPVVEPVAEPVVEPVVEQVVAPVNPKLVRKPKQVELVPTPPVADIPDLEDQVPKRMKAFRDIREAKIKEIYTGIDCSSR